jgi:hypothetical protein
MVSKHQAELVQIDHCRLETMQVLGVLAAGRWQTCSKKNLPNANVVALRRFHRKFLEHLEHIHFT